MTHMRRLFIDSKKDVKHLKQNESEYFLLAEMERKIPLRSTIKDTDLFPFSLDLLSARNTRVITQENTATIYLVLKQLKLLILLLRIKQNVSINIQN